MAKSKKADAAAVPDAKPAVKKKTPARKSATTAKPAATGSGAGGAPMIDTGLAAQAAARMLLARSSGAAAATRQASAAGESEGFKQLKNNLGKPHPQAMEALLNNTAPPGSKRSNLPIPGGRNQVGHNQTFSADVSRAGVPRRTGG